MKLCYLALASLPLASAFWWPFAATEDEKTKARGDEYDYEYYYNDDPSQRSGDYYYYDQYVDRSGSGSSINPLAALIAPLAGLALLAAASAVAVNPILLQLITITKRRRKRGTGTDFDAAEESLKAKIKQLTLLDSFLNSVPGGGGQGDLMTVGYLSCSGLVDQDNQCLQLLACQYTNDNKNNTSSGIDNKSSGIDNPVQRDVTSIVLYNLMSNKLVSQDLKNKLKKAARYGRDEASCKVFSCDFSSVL